MSSAVAALLDYGKRLHLQHGPIDLIMEAEGEPDEVAAAYRQASFAFSTVLEDLVAELPLLRQPCVYGGIEPSGAIAARMHAACIRHCGQFVTPMAAVAGAVADHVLSCAMQGRGIERAYVNNGGDIALHLSGQSAFRIAICSNPETGGKAGTVTIRAADPVRGIATSGWRGRSFSLGIADMVTVLAHDAAAADAAATMVANAADPGDYPEIVRRPAVELAPDSDLGSLAVTVDVGQLSPQVRCLAANRGLEAAREMVEKKWIQAALILVQGEMRMAGPMELSQALREEEAA